VDLWCDIAKDVTGKDPEVLEDMPKAFMADVAKKVEKDTFHPCNYHEHADEEERKDCLVRVKYVWGMKGDE
jgi:hypothetical protein